MRTGIGQLLCSVGCKAASGEVFSPEEYGDKQGGYPVAVIGERLWNRFSQRDRGVLDRVIRVNRQQLTIVGIVPENFHGALSGLTFESWVPVMMAPQLNAMPEWMLRDRQSRLLIGVARLKDGVRPEQVRAKAVGISQELARTTRKRIGALGPLYCGYRKVILEHKGRWADRFEC